MFKRLREFLRPADWDSALQALRRPHAAALAIGPRPTALGGSDAEVAVDLSRLDLDYVKPSDVAIEIGALTPLQDLVESATLQSEAGGLLPAAAQLSAHIGLRNVATLAGVLTSPEGPPEVLLALLALEATVDLRGDQRRQLPVAEFVAGGATFPGEVIAAVSFVRHPKGAAGALERVARTPHDQAIVAAAAVLDVADGVCRQFRLAIAGASPRPRRVASAERILAGQRLTADLLDKVAEATSAEVAPVSDFRGSAEYRRAMAGVLARRAVAQAAAARR